MDSLNLEHVFIPTNGIQLHVVQAGPLFGSPVILLHGFPEFWYGWRKQLAPLTAAGFRVWAPDQRGYNLSDKPKGIHAYQIDELAGDVIDLIDATGVDRCYLAGHDWGAAVAWWVAQRYPDRMRKLAILNVPHPAVMMQTLSTSPAQLRKSWYMFFFQLPCFPEAILRNNDWQLMEKMLISTSQAGSFTPEDIEQYRQAWWRKGAVPSMINWYRAAMRLPPSLDTDLRIHVPTLILWGDQDIALESRMAQASADLCDDARLVMLAGASHWIQHDEADFVNNHLIDFFSR